MPLTPNLLERMALRMNMFPTAYLDVIGAVAYRAVSMAVKFGVFEKLRVGPQTPKELAGKIGGDERATRILLEMLEAFGYIKSVDGRFANTPLTAKWLLEGPKGSFADVFRSWGTLFEFWSAHEDEVLRSGKPKVTLYDWFNEHPDGWRVFHAEEIWYARLFSDDIAAKLKLPEDARRALDVGGGHGMYSVALCRRYPNISATVFDQPLSLEYAKETIASEKMGGRISTRPGNFMVDDLGGGYDLVLLFNIVHGLLPEANRELTSRVAKALKPGGLVVVFDQLVGGEFGSITKASNRFWGLVYLTLLGGQVYSAEEVKGWLTASGFGSIRRVSVRLAGSSLLIEKKLK